MNNELLVIYNIFEKYGLNLNDYIGDSYSPIYELTKLSDAIDSLKRIYRDTHYIEVQIFNREGNIKSKLSKEFPSCNVYWVGDHDTIGTNHVFVPIDEWNDEMKEKLSKFDSFVGVHQEKIRRRKRDEYGIEIYDSKTGKYEYEEILKDPYEVKLCVIDSRQFSPKWEKINEGDTSNETTK